MAGRLKADECRAGPYRLTALKTMLATGGYCLLVLVVAPFLGRKGTGKADLAEHIVIAAIVFFTFLAPCLTLFVIYGSVRGWDRWKDERLKQWLATLSVTVIRVTCGITLVLLTGFIFLLNYEEPTVAGGLPPADPFPYKRSLSYHVHFLFFFVSIGMLFITTMGLLIPNPDDEAKTSEKPASPADDREDSQSPEKSPEAH